MTSDGRWQPEGTCDPRLVVYPKGSELRGLRTFEDGRYWDRKLAPFTGGRVREGLGEALDVAATAGFWPITGRRRVLAGGHLPIVCIPIEEGRRLAEALQGFYGEGSLGERTNTEVIEELAATIKAQELSTLRELMAKYPDEGGS